MKPNKAWIDDSSHCEHAFFEQPQLQGVFSNALFQITTFPTQVFDFGRRRGTGRIARQPLLPSFKDLLGPPVIQSLGNALRLARRAMTGSGGNPSEN